VGAVQPGVGGARRTSAGCRRRRPGPGRAGRTRHEASRAGAATVERHLVRPRSAPRRPFRPLLAPPTRADPPVGYRQRRRRQGSPDCPKPTLGGFPAVAVRAVASGAGPHLRTEPRRAVGRADRRPRPQPSPRRPATAPDPVRTLGAAAGVVFAAACARRALRRGGVVAHPVAATVASHARAGRHETTWGLASRPSPRPPTRRRQRIAVQVVSTGPGGGAPVGGFGPRKRSGTRRTPGTRRDDDARTTSTGHPHQPPDRGVGRHAAFPRSAGSQPDRPPGPRPLTASGDLAQRGRPRADGGPVAHARRRVGAVPGRRGVRSAGCCCVRSRPRRPDGSRLCGRTGLPWFRQWRRSRVSGVVGGPFTRLRSPDRSGVSWDPWAG
jgi:hypothetical protein